MTAHRAPAAGRGGAALAAPGAPPGDPVRRLLEEHRALCEQAVDPLEIAAGLEDAGIGPAEAARYRHADVFGLAEELYARVPRRPPSGGPPGLGRSGRRLTGWPAAAYWLGVLLLVVAAVSSFGPAFGLAVAVGPVPAEWVAGRLGRAARVHLATAVTMADFRSRLRPVLPVAIVVQLAAFAALGFVTLEVLGPGPAAGTPAQQWAALLVLGLLLLSAAVLRRCDRSAVAAGALLAAGTGNTVLALVEPSATARLLVCGAVTAVLLPYTRTVLGRPGAHRTTTALPDHS